MSISKLDSAKSLAGIPTKEQLLLSPQNTDKVPAVITPPQGLGSTQQGTPAALTKGEYVFSIPAIIGFGDGNYDNGLKHLDAMHQQLKMYGTKMMGGAQGDPNVQAQQPPENNQPLG